MRILFIGCVESSMVQLKLLLSNGANIAGVITKESSSINADFCDLSIVCKKNNIPFIYSKNINDEYTIDFVRTCRADIGYCFGWSQLIKKDMLNIFPMGIIGNHPAELPSNRGRHPIIWALVLGLDRTASTFFRMNEGADTGDIISQEIIPITYEDNARTLYNKVTESECRQIITFTKALEKNEVNFIKQKETTGNAWRKRSVKDGIIDWRMSTRSIYNLVRALSEPYPGASFVYNNNSIRVWKCEEEGNSGVENIEPGKIVQVENEHDFKVKAYDGIMHITDCDHIIVTEGEYL